MRLAGLRHRMLALATGLDHELQTEEVRAPALTLGGLP
jgi:hypothetical protein